MKIKLCVVILIVFIFSCKQESNEEIFIIMKVEKVIPIKPTIIIEEDSMIINPEKQCLYCFDSDTINMRDTILFEEDIEMYDWQTHTILLSEKGLERIKKIEIPIEGIPISFRINNDKIYDGWLHNVNSSEGKDITIALLIGRHLRLEHGIGFEPYGDDKRNNQKLKKHFERKGVLKK